MCDNAIGTVRDSCATAFAQPRQAVTGSGTVPSPSARERSHTVVDAATSPLKNRGYLYSSFTLLMFFASWGVWWSFFQIWLKDEDSGLGLSNSEVGTVYAVNSFATLVIMFFYGTLQDRLGMKRYLAILAAALMAGVAPFFLLLYKPLLEGPFMVGVVLGAIILSAGFMASVGLFEALAERFSRKFDFEYGQARMWGSAGYAVAALLAGFLFTINPAFNFIAGSVFGIVCLLVQLFFRTESTTSLKAQADAEGEASVPGFGEMLGLLKLGRLWLVIVFVLCTWTFYTVYDQQMFPDFYVSLFETKAQGQQVYGVLNSVQVGVEAAMMGLVPILMRKVGVRTTLLLGCSVMSLRILGSAVFDDPVLVSVVKMFHAVEVPLFILAIFRYFTLHFNTALSATLYIVGFQISAQIGNVILSQPLGKLVDNLGYQPTFFVISAIVAAAGVYAFFTLKRDDKDVFGDPFLRDKDRPKVADDPATGVPA
jgi:MFS transporter, OHS family, lactose permease